MINLVICVICASIGTRVYEHVMSHNEFVFVSSNSLQRFSWSANAYRLSGTYLNCHSCTWLKNSCLRGEISYLANHSVIRPFYCLAEKRKKTCLGLDIQLVVQPLLHP